MTLFVCAIAIAIGCDTPNPDTSLRAQALPLADGKRLDVHDRFRVPLTGQLGDPLQSINDVTVAGTDRVIVLEGETNSLLLLSSRGKVLSTMFNTGSGAMLANPVHMAWKNATALLVADGDIPQLAEFELRDDSILLSSVLPLQEMTSVRGACSLAGATFVIGKPSSADNRMLIHAIDAEGRTTESFGDALGPPDAMNDLFYGRHQRLLCLADHSLMLVASRYYPGVHALGADGTLRWAADIPHYRAVTYTEVELGRFHYNYPDDELWDKVVSLFQATEDVTAVQVERRRGRVDRGPSEGLYTVLIETSTGQPVGLQTDLPLVTAAGAGRLFGVDSSGVLLFLQYVLGEH